MSQPSAGRSAGRPARRRQALDLGGVAVRRAGREAQGDRRALRRGPVQSQELYGPIEVRLRGVGRPLPESAPCGRPSIALRVVAAAHPHDPEVVPEDGRCRALFSSAFCEHRFRVGAACRPSTRTRRDPVAASSFPGSSVRARRRRRRPPRRHSSVAPRSGPGRTTRPCSLGASRAASASSRSASFDIPFFGTRGRGSRGTRRLPGSSRTASITPRGHGPGPRSERARRRSRCAPRPRTGRSRSRVRRRVRAALLSPTALSARPRPSAAEMLRGQLQRAPVVARGRVPLLLAFRDHAPARAPPGRWRRRARSTAVYSRSASASWPASEATSPRRRWASALAGIRLGGLRAARGRRARESPAAEPSRRCRGGRATEDGPLGAVGGPAGRARDRHGA